MFLKSRRFSGSNRCLATACSTRRASRMMPSNGSIRMRRHAEKRGLPGAGLRASSVRDAQDQSIVRSVSVNCCNADSAVIRHRRHRPARHQAADAGVVPRHASAMAAMQRQLGRTDRMLFLDTMTLERELLPLPADSELLVMHSGVPRSLAGSNYNRRRAECEAAAAMLGVRSLRMVDDLGAVDRLPSPLRERARHVITENRRVLAARNADAAAFGALMMQSHASLRDDYAVSLPAMDALVAALQQEPGVFGARLTGAGFGGCCVALVREGTAAAIGSRVASYFGEVPSVVVPSRC